MPDACRTRRRSSHQLLQMLLLLVAAKLNRAAIVQPYRSLPPHARHASLLRQLDQVHVERTACFMTEALTGRQKRHLRAVAGRLEEQKLLSRLQVGDLERSIQPLRDQLAAVELVRCKFVQVQHKSEAKELADRLATEVDATVAQVLGHTALMFKPSAKGLIELPPAKGPGAAENIAEA